MNQLPFPLVISQRGYAPMKVSTTFTYRGPFPWRCCMCARRIRAGDQAFYLYQGGPLLMGHAGGCPAPDAVAVGGTEPPTTRL